MGVGGQPLLAELQERRESLLIIATNYQSQSIKCNYCVPNTKVQLITIQSLTLFYWFNSKVTSSVLSFFFSASNTSGYIRKASVGGKIKFTNYQSQQGPSFFALLKPKHIILLMQILGVLMKMLSIRKLFNMNLKLASMTPMSLNAI